MYVFNTVQNPKSYGMCVCVCVCVCVRVCVCVCVWFILALSNPAVYSFGLTLTVKKKPAASLKLESGRADNITFLLVDLKEISDPLTDLHIKQNCMFFRYC